MWEESSRCTFAIGVRHIQKYVEEEKTDLYCSTYVVNALRYRGGIANEMVELYSIDRKRDGIRSMMDAVKEIRIFRMGRLSEISYEACGEVIHANAYEYSRGNLTEYIINAEYLCRRKNPPRHIRSRSRKEGPATNSGDERR